ncbi:MAG: Omp28-related outer membrane protein [Weeksellaceae bacterium]|jgi:hypothetical protein|nr:Omp28-related outer membrane protein [Weeksellaceae bacterium]MDX9704227.1 Omp28-related outer membrane protein [Weeksellaceae bacterium]
MKHFITKFLLSGLLPLAVYGQTIVSTTPENRKIILEEFTGIYCVYCPQGHIIAEQIMTENPGNAFAINIHQGGYANPNGNDPDFRTQWGNAIANQTGLGGYPAATVNRQNFPGMEQGNSGTTAMNRNYWKTAANQIKNTASYVNMAVEASINIDTRELTVLVEAYYTGSSPQSTNFLNVALLQNNTKGPQTGGNQGNNYNHMRRLVDLITGQWGEEISTTTEGSFVSKTYTYTIPNDYKNIPAILPDMEIVVFMTETHQKIISGNGAFTSLIGLDYQNDASIVGINEILPTCGNTVSPVFEFENRGENTITNLTFEYSVNGGDVHTYEWTGSLTSLRRTTVTLPGIAFEKQALNDLVISIVSSEDQNPDNNSMTLSFADAPTASSNTLHLTLHTDNNGSDTRWIIRKSNNQAVMQGNGYANNTTYEIEIELPGDDCYSFRIIDVGGDGGASFTLKDNSGAILIESDGDYGSGFISEFKKGALGLYEQDLSAVNIYPNPSSGVVNITSDAKIDNIYVYDLSGRAIYTANRLATNKTELDLTAFGKGTYIIKIDAGKTITTKKVVIK